MGYVKIGSVADLPEDGHAKEFTVDGQVICVARVESALSAMDNVCPHCSTQYPVTQCFECGASSPFGQWAASSAAPAGA